MPHSLLDDGQMVYWVRMAHGMVIAFLRTEDELATYCPEIKLG